MPLLAFIPYIATVIGSYLHGRGQWRKGVIMVAHLAITLAALWLSGVRSYWIGLAVPIVALYWFLFRSGAQAKAELDAMAGIGSVWKASVAYVVPLLVSAGLTGVFLSVTKDYGLAWIGFVPFAFLWVPALAVKVFHYRNNAWPDNAENRAVQAKQRAKVEIAVTIAPAGMSIAILIYAAMRGFYG